MSTDLFPPIGLWTETTQGLGVRQLEARSHLVSKAPTGEPIEVLTERQQLLQRIDALERRMTRVEDYLRDRTWSARWMRFKVWWLGLPAWMAKYPALINRRRKR